MPMWGPESTPKFSLESQHIPLCSTPCLFDGKIQPFALEVLHPCSAVAERAQRLLLKLINCATWAQLPTRHPNKPSVWDAVTHAQKPARESNGTRDLELIKRKQYQIVRAQYISQNCSAQHYTNAQGCSFGMSWSNYKLSLRMTSGFVQTLSLWDVTFAHRLAQQPDPFIFALSSAASDRQHLGQQQKSSSRTGVTRGLIETSQLSFHVKLVPWYLPKNG